VLVHRHGRPFYINECDLVLAKRRYQCPCDRKLPVRAARTSEGLLSAASLGAASSVFHRPCRRARPAVEQSNGCRTTE